MEDIGGSKLSGIRQIVRLKEILQKWQSVTISAKASNADENQSLEEFPPIIDKRLATIKSYDSDEESCKSPDPPPDVPKGYLAVYVGPELRRFIIPTSYLSHSLFKVVLEKVEEEFGFDHDGGLTIPCEIETFKFLLNCIEHHPNDQQEDRSSEDMVTTKD